MLDYLLVGGIAFGLAYWIAGTGAALWRSIAGALLGFIIGWVGGTAIFAAVLSAGDFGLSSFDRVIGRNFWFAFAGAGYGVHRARKKLKVTNTSLSNAPQRVAVVKTTTNDAYAKALAEIEENRIDKGTWARCYALSDGDELKAKAAYIKARAEVLGMASEWADTQPAGLDGSHINATSKAGSDSQTSTDFFPKWLVQSAIGLAVFGVLFALALPAYQDYSKRQAVAANPVQPPAPQVDWDKGVIAPPPAAQSESVTTKNGAYWEKDELVLNPNGDKGTPTPAPANNSIGLPSNRPSWELRAKDLMARAERGEIASVDGLTSRTAPVYGDEWSDSDTLVLENSQTWWTSSQINVGSFFMHLQNQSAKGLSGAALEYKGRPCNENASVNTSYLTLVTSIPPGGQAVVNFRTDFPIETKGVSCLVIKRAWK
jgi:Tfp pilus assembly major pilin PilA